MNTQPANYAKVPSGNRRNANGADDRGTRRRGRYLDAAHGRGADRRYGVLGDCRHSHGERIACQALKADGRGCGLTTST